MPGSDSFHVAPEGLREHAKRLDGLVDRLQTAVDAARQVSVPQDAYGVICQFVPAYLNPIEQRGVDALQAAAEGMDTAAGNMRQTARRYEAVDDRNAVAFDTLMR